MPLRATPLNQITQADLQRLVDNKVMEDKRLDYKEALPGGEDRGRKDLLTDVSAMANTIGGDILVGVREQRDARNQPTGIPEEIIGIEIENWDKTRLWLEHVIRDGLDPRIVGLEVGKVDLENGRAAVIIRIPASLQAPHQIMLNYKPSFYQRNAGGNSPMDVREIGQSFVRAASWMERAEAFRHSRVEAVVSGEGPVIMEDGGLAFLHAIPLASAPFSIDFADERVSEVFGNLSPLTGSGYRRRLNFDGRLHFDTAGGKQGVAQSYVQVFRDGTIEFCDSSMFRPLEGQGETVFGIRSVAFELAVVEGLTRGLSVLEQLGIGLPLVVSVSLARVKGYRMMLPQPYFAHDIYPIDRDRLLPPGQLVERREQTPEVFLKPVFDTIWNAAGYPRSLSYNERGEWIAG